MMKKTISMVLVITLAVLSACGGSQSDKIQETQAATAASETITETVLETAGEETGTVVDSTGDRDIQDEEWDQLESLGKVQTEDGVLTVAITLPAEFAGEDVTQDELDAEAGENYKSATLNEDGSVTYKMTKKQHRAMLDGIIEGFDESMQDLVEDDTYSFTEIVHNKDYSVYDITVDAEEVGLSETFSVYLFYMLGEMYGKFSGHEPEKVVVNFYNTAGDLVETFDSSNMEE